MSRSVLHPLLEVVSEKRQKAQAHLANENARQRQAQDMLSTLLSYRQEYEQRWRTTTGNGLSNSAYHAFQRFLDRLDTAISQQHAALALCAEQIRLAQTRLEQATIREKAIETLLQRDKLAQQAVEKKREQRTMDECATRLARSRSILNADTTPGSPHV
jgi:flagellar FliJ protein